MLSIMVSSTFADMQMERDALHNVVEPWLRRECARYGEAVRLVDLRWGVNTENMTEDEASRKVLDVCLDAIDHCEGYMICMLGGRYGWVPDYSRTDSLSRHHITQDESMERTSVTALEMRYGVLDRGRKRGERAVVLLRDSVNNLPDEQRILFEETRYSKELDDLKGRMETLPEIVSAHYEIDAGKEGTAGVEAFIAQAEGALSRLLRNIYDKEERGPVSEEERLRRYFKALEQEYNAHYVPVPALQKQWRSFLNGENKLLLVKGDTGSGKTAFAAHCAGRRVRGTRILPVFCAYQAGAMTPEAVIRYLCAELMRQIPIRAGGSDARKAGLPEKLRSGASADLLQEKLQDGASAELLQGLLSLYVQETGNGLVIVIDSPEQMECEPEEMLLFMPAVIPDRVRFVITTSESNPECLLMGEYWPSDQITVPKVENPVRFLRRWFKAQEKEISDELLMLAAKAPLSSKSEYLSLVARMLMMLSRRDFDAMSAYGEGIGGIHGLIRNKLSNLPSSLEEMGGLYLYDCGEMVAPGVAGKVLGAITFFKEGLRTGDILSIFEGEIGEIEFLRFTQLLDGMLFEDEDGFWHFRKPYLQRAAAWMTGDELADRVWNWVDSLDAEDEVRIRNGYLFYLYAKHPEQARKELLTGIRKKSPRIRRNFITGMNVELSATFRVLLNEEALVWFLDDVVPRCGGRAVQERCRKLLAMTAETIEGRDSGSRIISERVRIRVHEVLGEIYDSQELFENAVREYRTAKESLAEIDPGEEYALACLNEARNLYGLDDAVRSAVLALLVRAEEVFAQAPERSEMGKVREWEAVFTHFFIEAQGSFVTLRGSAESLGDLAKDKRRAGSSYVRSVLMTGLNGFDDLTVPNDDMIPWLRGMEELCLRIAGAMKGFSADGIRESLKLLSRILYHLRPAVKPDNLLSDHQLSEQAHAGYAEFREWYHAFLTKMLRWCNSRLRKRQEQSLLLFKAELWYIRAQMHEGTGGRAVSCLSHCCAIWERYHTPVDPQFFSERYKKALIQLADEVLKTGDHELYDLTINKWRSICYFDAVRKIRAAREEAIRYPDDVHQEAFAGARRHAVSVITDYALRTYLWKDFEFYKMLDSRMINLRAAYLYRNKGGRKAFYLTAADMLSFDVGKAAQIMWGILERLEGQESQGGPSEWGRQVRTAGRRHPEVRLTDQGSPSPKKDEQDQDNKWLKKLASDQVENLCLKLFQMLHLRNLGRELSSDGSLIEFLRAYIGRHGAGMNVNGTMFPLNKDVIRAGFTLAEELLFLSQSLQGTASALSFAEEAKFILTQLMETLPEEVQIQEDELFPRIDRVSVKVLYLETSLLMQRLSGGAAGSHVP